MTRLSSRHAPIAALVLALATAGTAAEPPRTQAQAAAFIVTFVGQDGPAEAQIARLIAQLGDESYAVREKATADLITLDADARPQVEQAARSDDPEVRLRAQAILKAPSKKQDDASADLAKAIDLAATARDKALVPLLLKLLASARVDARYAAEYGLRRITHQAFGYSAYASPADRTAAAARWQAWWREAEAPFAFALAPAVPMPAGVLVSSRRLSKVWRVSLAGKTVWAKEFEGEISRAKALSDGHVLLSHKTRGVVEEFDAAWKAVWSAGGGKLAGDVLDVQRLPNGNTLVAHMTGNRVVEFDRAGQAVWSRPVMRMPLAAQRLPNGNTLVAVYYAERFVAGGANGRVVELTRDGKVAWARQGLNMPTDAVALPNGHVLVTEQGASRVVEFGRDGAVVWQRKCDGPPNSAHRLPDGTTVINDTAKGVLLVGKDGHVIRTLDDTLRVGKLSLVPPTAEKKE